jgi:hypothetical protein
MQHEEDLPRGDHHIHNHIDGLLHQNNGGGVARTSTGVADPLANLEDEIDVETAQNVVDATVGVVGACTANALEDEEALRAGEEAAAAAMEGEYFCFSCVVFFL